MLGKQKKSTWALIGICCIAVIALIFWLKPQHQTADESAVKSTEHAAETGTVAPALTGTQAGSFSSKSQQDTQINCQIRTDDSNRLIVNEQTRDCFEYFITQYGEKNLDQIKADFISYTKASYKDPLLSQLTDLWSRYLQYRDGLGKMKPANGGHVSAADQNNPDYYRGVFSQIKTLRKQFFSDYEIEGLFGNEDVYNDYTINRMSIINDKSLSATEKAEKLKQLFNGLPEKWQESLQQLSKIDDLNKLTAEIKARGGSPEEIRQMRTQLVGPEATQRLEKLDVQRSDWKQRVDQYLGERDNIMKSSMSDSAKEDAVNQLRNQQFSNQQEQLRLKTFEGVHDQGGKLPYAD
ncbi:lipase secretion chaperone [Acinetobacter sp. WZC-1]|uniref:lipase secretion chaperone n=1 Tax=Acinetobacter sp. WZC-1 TaxID=3459034 RepID=UPI00403DE76A